MSFKSPAFRLMLIAMFVFVLALGVTAQDSEEEYTYLNPMGQTPPLWTDEQVDCAAAGVSREGPWTIGVSNYSLGNSWRVQMIAELESAAAENENIEELIVTNADGNVAKQISDIDDLIARGVDAILITPGSPDGIAPSVEDAYNAGIVTIIFNDFVETDQFHSIVWADQFKFGYIGGAWLREALGGEGNIILLEGIAGTGVSDLRSEGAIAGMGEGINILARQPAGWDYAQGKTAMEDFIAAFPDQIDGVYSQGGAMSQGAIDAFLAAGLDPVPVPGEGYNGFLTYWAENVDNGFTSIAPDEPTWQSVAALDVAVNCLNGETIEKWTELVHPLITDENVTEYARMDCPDGVWSNTLMSPEAITEMYGCEGVDATEEASS